MKILIYGAGVIGSIYAAKLYKAGVNITLLARGKRYENVKQHEVVIHDVISGEQIISNIPLTQELIPTDYYDLIIVTVRLDQLESVMPVLKANLHSSAIMFMLNKPDNLKQLQQTLPGKEIILGFPGVGGTYKNNQIEYVQIKAQKTTLGNIDGDNNDLVLKIKVILEKAGFQVELNANMKAWLKIHAIFISCVAAAITKEYGDSVQLGKNKRSVQIMVKSINEGFKAAQSLGLPIKPANLKMIFMTMPQWFSVWYWQKAMQGKTGTLAMAPHVNTAKEELQLLAGKVLTIVHASSVPTPTLDALLSTFIQTN